MARVVSRSSTVTKRTTSLLKSQSYELLKGACSKRQRTEQRTTLLCCPLTTKRKSLNVVRHAKRSKRKKKRPNKLQKAYLMLLTAKQMIRATLSKSYLSSKLKMREPRAASLTRPHCSKRPTNWPRRCVRPTKSAIKRTMKTQKMKARPSRSS